MKQNVGKLDKQIRIAIGILGISLAIFSTGTIRTIALIVAVAAFATSISGFCGLYTLLGINTCKIKKKK